MIKAILLDADGVALKSHRYFSEVYAEENNVPLDKVTPFFMDKFRACQKGQADLKEEIAPYLPQWNWAGTTEEFLQRWFKTETHPNDPVLELANEARKHGIKCYLATDQEKHRAEYINKELQFDQYFDGMYFSYSLGHQKSETEFFTKVIEDLQLSPDEIAYWDDDKENVDVAKRIGIHGHCYSDYDSFASQMKSYLS